MRKLPRTIVKILLVVALTLGLIPATKSTVSALSQFASPATLVVGQTGFSACDNASNLGSMERGMNGPLSVTMAGSRLIVADTFNNRILIYNNFPSVNFAQPDVIIGQSDPCIVTANQGGSPGANTLNSPYGVFSDGTRLFVADHYNHRVLIYNSIPTTNNASADVVIGQVDFTSNSANRGGSVADNTLYRPAAVFYNGVNLFITDRYNHRVLIYNSLPTTNGASADLVLGQSTFTTRTSNQGGRSASSLSEPFGVFFDGTRLFVSERGNNRVLQWDSLPTTNKQAADHVIGQPDFTHGGGNYGGRDAGSLYYPNHLYSDGTNLTVADYRNNRTLVFPIGSTDNPNANIVLGQADFVSGSANRGGSPAANTQAEPHGVWWNGTTLITTDYANNRALVYNSVPSPTGASASLVLGQQDMTRSSASGGITASNSLSNPWGIYADNSRLIVADAMNHRILIYNSLPSSNAASADVVLGQSDFSGNQINHGGSVSANSMFYPQGIHYDGTHLIVADYANNRVLIWNSLPSVNDTPADIVLGQPAFGTNVCNNGGVTASSMCWPYAVYSDGTRLLVADYSNNRVLIYNSFPTVNNQAADVVIGQVNLNSSAANQGGPVGPNTLSGPTYVYIDNGRLFVSDQYNHRVLVYNTIPATNDTSADVVVGQPDMYSNAQNQGGSPGLNTLGNPRGIWIDDDRLYVVEQYVNSRVLVWLEVPTVDGASADLVFGQPDGSTVAANSIGYPSASTVNNPQGISGNDSGLFLGDTNNHRVLYYPFGPQNDYANAIDYSVNNFGVVTIGLDLGADDAPEIMISEDPDFTDAVWIPYQEYIEYVLTNPDSETLYVKFRDYGNYEGEVFALDLALLAATGSATSSFVSLGFLLLVPVLGVLCRKLYFYKSK